MEYCILAGGCFWCMSKPYYEYDGIINVYSGYCGGSEENPKYEDVKAQKTGHFESVKLVYDPYIISYEEILDIYFETIDPFDGDGQFIDRGNNYKTAIFYSNDNMKAIALNYIKRIEEKFQKKVMVMLIPEMPFYYAEEYHQDFAIKNPLLMEEELILSGRKKK